MINQTQRNVLLGLAKMLELAPDFRIGQLFAYILSKTEEIGGSGHGLYDVEDDELESILWPMINMWEQRHKPSVEEQLELVEAA